MYDLKDRILDLDIIDIVEKYITIQRAGANYKACCPFHKENTPSLMISPGKNLWKCFGCGKGGNAIDFVMEHDGLEFYDAMKKIAGDYNIPVPEIKEKSEDDRKKEKHREALFLVNKVAAGWFREQLENSEVAKGYVMGRWSEDSIKLWGLGFAPDTWDSLLNYASERGVKKEILLEAGLLKENEKGKIYDSFRNRIMFPIHDRYGNVLGFSGRTLSQDKKTPKYINSKESQIFVKGSNLFGLHQAMRKMKEKKQVYLVEGNPDVMRLQELNIDNAVAPLGTSLTIEQVKIISRNCKSVNIIGDNDSSGQKAVERSAKMLIQEGLSVNVVNLPSGDQGGKQDPDSFFTSTEQFKKYVSDHITDYIILKALERKDKVKNPDFKARVVNDLSDLIVCFDDNTIQDLYIEQLGGIIKPKKLWSDRVKYLQKDKNPQEKTDKIPDNVSLVDFERYGFYEDHNSYFFRTNKGILKGCNFTMKPLFHIQKVQDAKRLYEIKNEHGHTEVIELLQRDLVGLARFKERVESLGNFLWEASESELNKLKRYLYEKTETCIEITQLGWQKFNFYAWGNGIYNETWHKVDEHGIVRHDGLNYYLPAFSSVYKHEDGLYQSERKFIHRDSGEIDLPGYMKKLQQVFGDNAVFAVSFYIATLFRDHIVRINNFFPVLNLFGPKGAGKTELAVSILQFFGKQSKGPNINNTTKPALADHVAQVANACVHIDEYKNNIEFEKIEFLKGLWDGTGRTRMNMDKDKKKETTAVDSGIILSGQEMPTADIALFSRLVYLSFYKSEYNDKEKKAFNELKLIEKKGLTHITHKLLSHRSHMLENYANFYDKVSRDMDKLLGKEVIEDRIFRNWVVILAAYACMLEVEPMPYTYNDLLKLSLQQIKIQNRETKKSNEISTFWSLVQYLYSDGFIMEDVDFKIEFLQHRLKTDMVDVIWDEPKNIIFIQHSRLIPLYRKHGKQQGEKVLPTDSINYYLQNDKRFLGKKRVAFKAIDPKTGIELMVDGKRKRKVTNAYAFLYDDLDITLNTEEEEDNSAEEALEALTKMDNENLPY